MLTLAASSGSKSYELAGRASTPEKEETLFFNAVQLLEAQGQNGAAEILRSWSFHLYHGDNDFADDFQVLHAELPHSQFVDVKKRFEADPNGDLVRDIKLIQEVLGDLNIYVRFVSCAPRPEEAPQAWRKGVSMIEVDRRRNYALESSPLGRGGNAEVYRATDKRTGKIVAFKRALDNDDESVARLRREIEEQGKLDHPHVMPILDHSETFDWFTMPCAVGDLERLRSAMDEPTLIEMLDQSAQGLAAAHKIGLVHRDVTPRNILVLEDAGSRRCVVADWGLVRRPPGMTTVPRTAARQTFGTEGFAAPELWDNAHAAGPEADVYGLGRVAAWATTGEWPKPNIPLEPDGRWRRLVHMTTELDRARRVATMDDFRKLLAELREEPALPPKSALGRADEIYEAVGHGDVAAIEELASLAEAHPDEPDLYVYHLPRMPRHSVRALIASHPAEVKNIIESMRLHLTEKNSLGRSYELADGPLQWVEWVAKAAAEEANQGLLEDAASCLFAAEAQWQRFKQRWETREWLESINDKDAQTVARALRRCAQAVQWYTDEGWRPKHAHLLIRQALGKG